jgi:hypothetical protein
MIFFLFILIFTLILGITKIPIFSKTVIPRTPIPNTGKYRYLNKKIKAIKGKSFLKISLIDGQVTGKIKCREYQKWHLMQYIPKISQKFKKNAKKFQKAKNAINAK